MRVKPVATLLACAAAACSGAPAVEPVDATPPLVDDGAAVDAAAPPDTSPDAADAACAPADPPPTDETWTLVVDGRERTVLVHVPPAYDGATPLPVVVNLHALGASAEVQAWYSRMIEKADAEGFIVVHPEGIGGSWNAGVGCCGTAAALGVDDVGLITATLDALAARRCVARDRIYATGMSNGGYMTHRLGCALADRLAAIAPIAGIDVVAGCAPAAPLPVLQIHGTLDTVVPYAGALTSVASWRDRNGCAASTTVVADEPGTRCVRHDGCADGAEVVLCTVVGGGHVWPGGVASASSLDATDAVWAFFARHARRP